MNRANRPRLSRISGSSYATKLLGRAGDGSTLSLDFTTGVLDPRLTFSRDGGGTYIGNDGRVYGVDFATSSSLAIGTGSKSVTLTATAGVDRRYLVGQTVWISNGANNMRGPVTAYDASTQVLTIDATATSGSGSFTSWTVGNASARFDYDPTTGSPRGLLIEGQAQNLLTRSQALATSPWSAGNGSGGTLPTVDNDNDTAPDGTQTATRVQLNITGGGFSRVQQLVTGTIGVSYTFSVWMKLKSGSTPVTVAIRVGSDGNSTNTNKTVTSSWQRFQTTYTLAAAPADAQVMLWTSLSTSTTADVLVWGAQLEAGSGASSYIPTGASQGTRNADECSMTGTNFSSWFTNPNEGSFLVRYSMNYPGASMGAGVDRYAFEISNSGGSSRALCIAAYRNAPAGRNVRVFNPSGTSFDSGDTLTTSAALNTKFAFGYATADNYIAAVGVAQAFQTYNTGSLPTSPAINQMHLGASRTFGSVTYLQGCISLLKYWPTRLPNATLQGLVS